MSRGENEQREAIGAHRELPDTLKYPCKIKHVGNPLLRNNTFMYELEN